MQDLPTPDRRRDERVDKQTYASVVAPHDEDEGPALGVVCDVSRHGLGVHAPHRFYPGEEVVVRVAVGHRLHDVAGEVRRCDPAGNDLWTVGIELDPDREDSRDFFEAFLPCTLLRAR